jgi:hypothetical protein
MAVRVCVPGGDAEGLLDRADMESTTDQRGFTLNPACVDAGTVQTQRSDDKHDRDVRRCTQDDERETWNTQAAAFQVIPRSDFAQLTLKREYCNRSER